MGTTRNTERMDGQSTANATGCHPEDDYVSKCVWCRASAHVTLIDQGVRKNTSFIIRRAPGCGLYPAAGLLSLPPLPVDPQARMRGHFSLPCALCLVPQPSPAVECVVRHVHQVLLSN